MKYPIAKHPSFGETWSDYTKKFNFLADLIADLGLNVQLLRDVTDAVIPVEELSSDVGDIRSFVQGFLEGLEYKDKGSASRDEVDYDRGESLLTSSVVEYLESRIMLREVENLRRRKFPA